MRPSFPKDRDDRHNSMGPFRDGTDRGKSQDRQWGVFVMNDYKNAFPWEVDVAEISRTPEGAFGEASDETERTNLREEPQQ